MDDTPKKDSIIIITFYEKYKYDDKHNIYLYLFTAKIYYKLHF